MRRFLLFVAILTLGAGLASAQLTSSTIRGTVSGPDGLVPGATVVLRDTATGRETTVTTSGAGAYTFPNVVVGTYTVTVTAPGFKTATIENVVVEVSRAVTQEVTLEIGAVEETVTVTAGTEIVNTADGKIGNSVNRKQLDDLPSLGRNPLNFVPLQPGAASNPSQNTVINGVRTSGTNTTIDGVNVQDNFIRSNATDFSPARPTVDEVEEFQVASQSNADDGFGGAQIQFTTRRGGNKFNVRLFEFNRNDYLAANGFFNNAQGIERQFRNLNQFGGNVGGPIIKNKAFFFFSYEKLIDRQPAFPVQLSTTLTNAASQGIFTYTANANDPGNGIVQGQIVQVSILNPALGTGIIATNPVVQSRFLANLPSGNSTQVGDQRNTTGFAVNQIFNPEQTNYATRVDYNVNSQNTINGVFRFVRQDILRADIDNAFNNSPRVTQPSVNPFLSLGWTWVPSSRWSNELRGGWFNSEPVFLRSDANPANFVNIPLATNPEVTFQDQGRIVDTVNLQDNATFIFRNHNFRFGGQFQSVRIDAFNDAGIVPTFTIGTNLNTPQISTAQFTNFALFPGGVPVAQRGAANALLALHGGIISAGAQTFNVETQDSGFVDGATQRRQFEYEIYAFYFSDQWKVRRDLTVNLGIRYDIYTGLRSSNGLALEPVFANNDDPVSSLLDPNGTYQFVGGNIGKEGQFYNTDFNNFSPILSFAWNPDVENRILKTIFGSKPVFRGGYRISYINDELVRAPDNALTGNQGLALGVAAINPNTNTTALNERIDNLPTIPTPTFTGPNRTYVQNNQIAGLFGTVFGVDPNIQSPLVQEYSFGVTREIGWDTAVEIRYVGTRSNNLLRGVDYNQVDIRANGFLDDFNRARGNLLLCQATAGCNTGGNYNPAVTGSQVLTVFPNLVAGGLLTNSTVVGQLVAGIPADLAIIYKTNGLEGTVNFLPNPNTGVADLLENGSRFNYNSLQVDVRRRFTDGLSLNANYTFSKNLTDGQGTGQTRFEPFLDILQQDLEYSRADFDQTHTFNVLTTYELPMGQGKRFFNKGGLTNTLLGGFQIGAIFKVGSGAPITFTDARGTLNRAGRSGRQTALTNLTASELQSLVGIYRTPNGIFFLPPAVLGRNADGTINSAAGGTGRGANGFDTATFAGQIFFNNAPGQTSGLSRAVVTGPTTYILDLSLIKRFRFGERFTVQVQGDLFNAFNTVNFVPGQFLDINGTNFGRISATTAPRVSQLALRIEF
ncbi:MAG: TonB-dependent receptor [Acidobacteria bacterium]|nr:TonB-dependent receptor [Acidobacteriota bacterium]